MFGRNNLILRRRDVRLLGALQISLSRIEKLSAYLLLFLTGREEMSSTHSVVARVARVVYLMFSLSVPVSCFLLAIACNFVK